MPDMLLTLICTNMYSVLVIILITVAILFGYLTAKPYHTSKGDFDILYEQDNKTGDYEYHIYEAGGLQREETGKIEKTKDGTDFLRAKGHYYYEWDDNDIAVSVNYTADENGFRATFQIKSYTHGDKLSDNCVKSICGTGQIG